VAEGGGLLNRYRGNTPIVGSNPIPSATLRPCGASGGKPPSSAERFLRVLRRLLQRIAIVEQHDRLVLVGKMHGCLSATTISA
jgi:hypothetical protein